MDIEKELEELLQTANDFNEKKEFGDAIKYFDKALALNPRSSKAMYWKAFMLYHDMGEILESLKLCDKCLREGINTNYDYTANLLILKADIFCSLSKNEEALLLAEKALDIIGNDNTKYAILQKSYLLYSMMPHLRKRIKKDNKKHRKHFFHRLFK